MVEVMLKKNSLQYESDFDRAIKELKTQGNDELGSEIGIAKIILKQAELE